MLRWLTLLLLLVHVTPQAAAKVPQGVISEGHIEGVQAFRLPNGLRVLLVPEPSAASLTVEVAYSVGSRHEGYGEAGMAHLLEHLMFKGTSRFPKPDEEIDKRGGEWNAETEVDHTRYYQTHLPGNENLRLALAIEADRMTQVRFRQSDLSREFQVVRNELELADSEPRDILVRRIHHAAFSVHSYGRDPIGTRSDIERVSIARLQAFYARHYRPDNAHLIVAGPIAVEPTLGLIVELFGKIRAAGPPAERTYTEEPPQDGERYVTVRRVGKLPLVGLYYHTVAAADPDQAALLALSDILTRPGSGRLYKALVETGLAVQVSSDSELRSEPGGLLILTELRSGGDPAKVTQVMTSLIEDLAHKGISAEELRRFQARALVNHERLLRSPSDLTHMLGMLATTSDYRLLFLLRDRIQRLTIEEVQQAAQRYLSRQNRTVGQFIPAEQPPPKHARPPVDVSLLFRQFHGGAQVQPGEPFAQTPSAIAQRVITRKLATGMQLIMVPKKTRGQHVELALHLSLGSAETLRGKEAAIGLLAPLLLRGSRQHDHQQLLDELDRHKAELLASSEGGLPGLISQQLDMAGSTVRDELPALLGLLHEVLTAPGLRPEQFERIRQQALAACEDQTHNPMTQALIKLVRYSSPWPSSDPRYLPTTNEQITRLLAVTLDDLRTLAAELLGGEHATLVIVGDFDPEAISQQVTKLFSGFVAKRPFVRLAHPFQTVQPSSLTVQLPDRDSSAVAVLLPFALKDSDPDYPALLLWQQIFGGNTTARLNQRLRERDGLSYEVRSSLRIPTLDDNAYLAALATSAPQNGRAALTAISEEIKLLLDKGPTVAELAQAQQGYDRQLDAMISDDDDLAMLLARLSAVGRDIRYLDELRAKVRNVTKDELLHAAQRHLRNAPLVSALTHE